MTDFRDYKTNARYAEQINAGYSARLVLAHRFDNDGWNETSEGKAFQHGWDMADRHEKTNRSEK